MTKKEVALIKETIDNYRHELSRYGSVLDETGKMAYTARIDILVWLLVETGNDEGLDPELHPEDFK